MLLGGFQEWHYIIFGPHNAEKSPIGPRGALHLMVIRGVQLSERRMSLGIIRSRPMVALTPFKHHNTMVSGGLRGALPICREMQVEEIDIPV